MQYQRSDYLIKKLIYLYFSWDW